MNTKLVFTSGMLVGILFILGFCAIVNLQSNITFDCYAIEQNCILKENDSFVLSDQITVNWYDHKPIPEQKTYILPVTNGCWSGCPNPCPKVLKFDEKNNEYYLAPDPDKCTYSVDEGLKLNGPIIEKDYTDKLNQLDN